MHLTYKRVTFRRAFFFLNLVSLTIEEKYIEVIEIQGWVRWLARSVYMYVGDNRREGQMILIISSSLTKDQVRICLYDLNMYCYYIHNLNKI